MVEEDRCISICSVSGFVTNILSGALTCVFALVGSLVGAITGALAGRASHSGLFRGAGLGAVAGAVLSVEVLEASRAYWRSQHSGSSSLLSITGFLADFFNGRFMREFLRPSFSSVQRWQVNLTEMSYEDIYDMLLPAEGRIKGASQEFLGSLPQHVVTKGSRVDACGDVVCCVICLQELDEGDVARTLPACKHTFHMKCVDEWLSRRLLCPVCRQYM
ncbi:hypothetical protein GOP47_0008520 [Adiantum capillus-veneris]|uniref:RING-type domain-containing protein n=1 Tax=Adiantum capillus-veneris TaxID=13818 RepID=A0A9D4UYI1_ADICA|nr:hypothetical protein GOP47_0008520 [Adiantum capillus-veneris]